MSESVTDTRQRHRQTDRQTGRGLQAGGYRPKLSAILRFFLSFFFTSLMSLSFHVLLRSFMGLQNSECVCESISEGVRE